MLKRFVLMLLITGLLYYFTIPWFQQRYQNNTSFKTCLVAVGDLHGDYEHAVRVLKMANLIDHNLKWKAKNCYFIQTGDIVDRGDDTIKLYKMMMRLEKEARIDGGRVFAMLGNHEVMNMQWDFRFVTKNDVDSFGGMQNRIKAWLPTGWLGSYLSNLPVSVLVDSTVFFHGGASVLWSAMTVDKLNNISRDALHHLSPEQLRQVGLFGDSGPLWYRDYVLEDEKVVCGLLDTALANLNASRMVVGHTPQFNGKILSRCNGKLFVIDVGISRVYGGHFAALSIKDGIVSAIYEGNTIRLSSIA